MFTVRIIVLTLLVNLVMAGAIIIGPAYAATSAGGFLGRPLPEVEQENFFKKFQLTELAKRETPYGAGVVVFRPAQPTVHFEVAITVDKTDHVLAVQLWLRRSFIDGGDSEPVAMSVVLGFLKEVPPGEDVQRLDGLADEIHNGHVVGAEPPKAGVPAKPSAGYLAIMGKRGIYQQALGESRLQILNYRDRFGPVMTVQVVPIGTGKHEQAKRAGRTLSAGAPAPLDA